VVRCVADTRTNGTKKNCRRRQRLWQFAMCFCLRFCLLHRYASDNGAEIEIEVSWQAVNVCVNAICEQCKDRLLWASCCTASTPLHKSASQ